MVSDQDISTDVNEIYEGNPTGIVENPHTTAGLASVILSSVATTCKVGSILNDDVMVASPGPSHSSTTGSSFHTQSNPHSSGNSHLSDLA